LVGFSYAAGLGAKAAAPGRTVVTLMGDGGFAMTMAELTTAVSEKLPTVSVVLDNGCWGAEKAYQRDFYNGRYIGADITSLPYDKVAQLAGARGYAVSEPGQLSDMLKEAIASGEPSVLHVKVDPDAIVSFRRDSFKHRLPS
jgi:acetolactate synthase-1/2/3 large subunit/sulfoacetaldehyde acetyltransferase